MVASGAMLTHSYVHHPQSNLMGISGYNPLNRNRLSPLPTLNLLTTSWILPQCVYSVCVYYTMCALLSSPKNKNPADYSTGLPLCIGYVHSSNTSSHIPETTLKLVLSNPHSVTIIGVTSGFYCVRSVTDVL